MPALEPLCKLIGLNPKKFTKQEFFLLEIELFTRVCEELKKIIKIKFIADECYKKNNEYRNHFIMEFYNLIINIFLKTLKRVNQTHQDKTNNSP